LVFWVFGIGKDIDFTSLVFVAHSIGRCFYYFSFGGLEVMAKIACIADGTKREGNSLDDIVDIYDDDVVLGPAYATFKIIDIPGVKKKALADILNAMTPKVFSIFQDIDDLKYYVIPEMAPDEDRLKKKSGYLNADGKLEVFDSKYHHNVRGITKQGEDALKDTGVNTVIREALLKNIANLTPSKEQSIRVI